MKLVEFTTDMAPHRTGDTRLVPDDVARRLVVSSEASIKGDWPPKPQEDATKAASREARLTYRTKSA